MFVATFIMIVGIAAIATLSHRWGYRLGGVMVVPLLVIYTFREPYSPLVFLVGTVAARGALWAVREYTLTYGRRAFLIGILVGVCATIVAGVVIDWYTPVPLAFTEAEIVASIFPGIAAYNAMRLDREKLVADLILMVALFAGLLMVGTVALKFFEGSTCPTPPVLALPTCELAVWLGVETRGVPATQITPGWLSVTLLVADVVIYEWVRKRYDLRLAGIIVVPLLAMFSLRLGHAAAVFAIGVTTVFVLLSIVHWISLLYGRVLLALSLVLGSLYTLAIGVFVSPAIPGMTLFFLGLFVGVAAYNLYRVSPPIRAASVRLSAGLFVVFYTVLAVIVEIPPGGLFSEARASYVVVGVCTLALSTLELYRLERSRPSPEAFARASVFTNVDGGDTDNSPFVKTDRGSISGVVSSTLGTTETSGDEPNTHTQEGD